MLSAWSNHRSNRRFLVLSAWSNRRSNRRSNRKCLVLDQIAGPIAGAWCAALRVHGALFNSEPRTKDQGPRTKDQGPRTKDQGPRTKDQGPRTKDPALLTTDYHRLFFHFRGSLLGLLILIVRFRANVSHHQILPDLQRIVCCILPVERNKN